MLKGPLRAGQYDVTYNVFPAPGVSTWQLVVGWRQAAGGQTPIGGFEWHPMAGPDAGLAGGDMVEATFDGPAIASVPGDEIVLQVFWQDAANPMATVAEGLPSMEIPGYQ